nr:glycosyltransferase family 4 protein [uncultured Methanobacterium sp.]
MTSMTKILFIHNTAMWYRIPFFKDLDQEYAIDYIFTHMQVSKDIYGLENPDNIGGMEDIKHIILPNHVGIAWGILKKAFQDYDLMVGGSWDSIPEIMESVYCYGVAWIRRKPIILWREDWAWEDTSLKSKLIQPLVKWIVRTSSAIVVPGSKHREYFIQLGADQEKIFLMPNASNQTIHEDDPGKARKLREKMDLNNKKILLYVGRLIQRKGVQYLIQALKKIETEDIMLLILGDGDYKDELQGMVNELGLENKVIFTGKVSQEELASYYITSDLVVVPSITHGIGDPWVLVLNEAMQFRKPVIATDAVGAASDMITECENGFIVPEKDVPALTRAINTILEDDKLRLEMGQKSFEIIQEGFGYSNMVEGFQKAVNYSLKNEK